MRFHSWWLTFSTRKSANASVVLYVTEDLSMIQTRQQSKHYYAVDCNEAEATPIVKI